MAGFTRWDAPTRTVRTYDDKGVEIGSRPFTQSENAAADTEAVSRTARSNRATIENQAATALAANKAFVGIAAPSNAQNAAQIKALSRQMNGVIRMLLNRFEGTD